MSFEVTVTPTVYDVEVDVNPSVQPFDVEVTVGNVPDLDLTTNGDSGASTFDPLTGELNIPNYTLDGLGGVPESRTITINGTTQDLSADRTFTIPAPDPVTIGSPANGLAIDGNQVLTIGLASGSQAGALSSTDWSTFNNKQNAIGYTPENLANKAVNFTSPDDTKYPTTLAVSTALAGKQDVLTNPITGTGVAGQVAFWTGTGTQSGSNNLFWDSANGRLGIGTNAPLYPLEIKRNVSGLSNMVIITNTASSSSATGAGIYLISDDNSSNSNGDKLGDINFGGRRTQGLVTNSSFIRAIAVGEWSSGLAASYIEIATRSTSNTLNLFRFTENGGLLINTTTDAGFRLDVNGTARVQGAITTGAPTGGTAKPFKIGAVATVTPTSPNRTIEIEIDGTTYYLTAKTTND